MSIEQYRSTFWSISSVYKVKILLLTLFQIKALGKLFYDPNQYFNTGDIDLVQLKSH